MVHNRMVHSNGLIRCTTILLLALGLTSACGWSGFTLPADAEKLSALSTENASLSTQVAVQDSMLATLAVENHADSAAADDPTESMEITASHLSPDQQFTAIILNENILAIEDSQGARQVLYETQAITGLSWFPDGTAIALSDLIDDDSSPLQVRDRVLLIDSESGEATVLADGFEPAVSPDGQWIAFYAGIQYGDACSVGWQLAFLELDENHSIQQTLVQQDFSGLPGSPAEESFYPSLSDDPAHPGTWTSPQQFESFFRRACVEDPGEDGIYLFDLENLTAQRIAGS